MARGRNDSGAAGILLVDKPEGPTSFDVVAKLRRALGTRAIGHTGTLDPLASGLLVVLVGAYTRLSNVLTADDKEYTATVRFGARTTTDDREGDVVESGDPGGLSRDVVAGALASMTGPQRQVPPMYSAISVGGERLYEKARRGEDLPDLPPRDVVVRRADLVDWRPPDAVVDVACSKGTYVRAIARDLGAKVGVPAHLAALRRTRAGAYAIDDASPLEALLEDGAAATRLLAGPRAVRGVPLVDVDAERAQALRQGRRVPPPEGLILGGRVGLAHHGDALVALVEERDGALRSVRGFGEG